jgi:hypothetical protein
VVNKNTNIVIWIQDSGDVLGAVSITHSLNVVTIVKESQVEANRSLGRPQAHGVHSVVGIARHWTVIWHGVNDLGVHPLGVAILILNGASIQIDRKSVLWSSLFPRVSKSQPIIWLLNLLILNPNMKSA